MLIEHAQAEAIPSRADATNPAAPAAGDTSPLADGSVVTVRRLEARDVELERTFIERLSPSSRRYRFLESFSSPGETLLTQLTQLDPAREAAFIAVIGAGKHEREIGIARFAEDADRRDCEFAVTVADEWQKKGLGSLLMRHLIAEARSRGIATMHSSDASANEGMRRLAAHLHFRHARDPEDPTQVLHTVDLAQDDEPAA